MGLVPLDDRPCNRQFPGRLAELAACRLLLPPRESLGWFTKPGDCDLVAAWLQDCDAERFVISLDMLCYGGLVASRSEVVAAEEAAARLETLRSLKQRRPDVTLFAFNVVTRLGTTVSSSADLEIHEQLRTYSQLVDRVERLGEEELRPQLDTVVASLDSAALSTYLAVRRRNHAINRAAIQLAAEGVVDYLVLAQEDAAPVGLHLPEQFALRGQAEEYRVVDKVAIYPGADEVGLVLTARQCAVAAGASPRIAIDYAAEAGANVVPRFEHQTLRETVESQIRASGARLAVPGEAEAMLFLHTPVGEQVDASAAPAAGQAPTLALQAESVLERVRAAGEAGYATGLADVAYCNGADPELMAGLKRTGAAHHLAAYAGWNTSANTIGTVVSQLCLHVLGSAGAEVAGGADSSHFLAARLLDDYGYQSCVRAKAVARAESTGADPHALGNDCQDSENYVSQQLQPLAHIIYSDLLAGREPPPLESLRVSLPWRRLFELEVEFDP